MYFKLLSFFTTAFHSLSRIKGLSSHSSSATNLLTLWLWESLIFWGLYFLMYKMRILEEISLNPLPTLMSMDKWSTTISVFMVWLGNLRHREARYLLFPGCSLIVNSALYLAMHKTATACRNQLGLMCLPSEACLWASWISRDSNKENVLGWGHN